MPPRKRAEYGAAVSLVPGSMPSLRRTAVPMYEPP
jgi:hypothetical protein